MNYSNIQSPMCLISKSLLQVVPERLEVLHTLEISFVFLPEQYKGTLV